ncbi:Hypothetical predicted protein [Olea europaea subsp. europaea]|uniref:Uncharacterized protein n=1 Tax=Olea europaea subsp. europaea TaxID=158383 RepID=A0A8S0SP19_OLEEU|nr:Hypothetical predicted protein [Olea europaea subsp. europaea]
MKTNKNGEVWFKIGDKRVRFGLEEFVLVTGLNAGDENDVDKTLGAECRIVKEYFKNSGRKIIKGDVYNAFTCCMLFEKYPWGKISFEYTMNVFRREIGGKLKSFDVGGESRCRYSLYGFPLAIMIWAFETISTLGMKFATKYPGVIPRMIAWEMPKRLASAAINIVLKSKELEVNSTLIPTEIELEEVYWKELTPIVEEDESALHDSEGDKAEHYVKPHHAYNKESPGAPQPPQPGFEMNVADLLRTKMKKLEERLQAVISTRIDRMEKKVGRLVELVVSGWFHPATSAFDRATSSIAYVLENELKDGLKKEAGFDDVTDVLAAERNVDLPEEYPKLKEEVREKNVGGNELETEPGFDDSKLTLADTI